MDHPQIVFRLVLLALLLCCSAFFSGGEVALFSLPQIRVASLRERGGAWEAAARLLDRPRKLLLTLLMGNEFVNVSISAVSGYMLVHMLGFVGYQAVIITAATVLVLGEIVPKTVAFRRPEPYTRLVARPLLLISWLVKPLRLVLEALVDAIVRDDGSQALEPVQRDDLVLMVDQMAQSGELDETESRTIHAILDLENLRVGEIMTPRTDMFTLPLETTAAAALPLVREGKYSRVPVVREDADHVEGILFARDLLSAPPDVRVADLAQVPLFVPELKRADDLLLRFRDERSHMAVVVDEFGGTAGIVTLDDVLEELFGKIPDEFDEREPSPLTQVGPGCWLVDAGMPLDDFSEQTGLEVSCEQFDTVGGWALSLVGHLPDEGERIDVEGLTIWVTAVKGTRIIRLKVESGGCAEQDEQPVEPETEQQP
ncbi:MAG: hemolysin family protein [Candidatus Alcyoniella australis]|nr:hemolysin family protein [Candidatus Alcyoniella australis]